ncbi:MAG: helicase C-terminal domain-containing protein [Candidatus Wallbacteria bacterium]
MGKYIVNNELTISFWDKFPGKIVFMDYETTGINFDTDQIIEIGLFALNGNRAGDEYGTLINPEVPIPPKITSITGINSDMTASAPLLGSQTGVFEKFVDGAVVFAHNADFERNFTGRDFKGANVLEFIDTCDIAMLLMPNLKYFNLEKILNHFNIKETEDHRALIDAKDTYYALNYIIDDVVSNYDYSYLKKICERADECLNKPTAEFFKILHDVYVYENKVETGAGEKRQDMVKAGRKGKGKVKSGELNKGFEQECFDFAPAPGLKESIAAVCNRDDEFDVKTQQHVVENIIKAFNEEKYVFIEMPYQSNRIECLLYGAMLYSKNHHENVLVIEPENTCVEQIAKKHIPEMSGSFDNNGFFILKNPENYLCKTKFNEFKNNAKTQREKFLSVYLDCYLEKAIDGDLENVSPFLLNKYPELKEKFEYIKSSALHCNRNNCKHYKDCYFMSALQKSSKARVIVAPFSVYLKWQECFGGKNLNINKLIIDQAHKIEDVFSEAMASKFCAAEVLNILNEAELFFKSNDAFKKGFSGDSVKCGLIIENIKKYASDFFEYGLMLCEQAQGDVDYSGKVNTVVMLERVFEDTLSQELFLEKLINFSIYMKLLSETLEKIFAEFVKKQDKTQEEYEILCSVNKYYKESERFWKTFIKILHVTNSSYSAYVKYDINQKEWFFYAEPFDIGRMLAQSLFTENKSIVFVSSAFSVNTSYDFIKWVLGLHKSKNLEIRNAHRNANFYPHSLLIPKEMPEFNTRNVAPFILKLSDMILKIASKKSGKMMVLFSSIDRMNQVYKNIYESLCKLGIMCLCQHSDGGKYKILERLKKAANCVVLGSQSFMDYSDIDDEAINTLIIEKLPFPFFDDPKIQLRKRFTARSGRLEFEDYILPKTILKLKQTIGRIKSKKSGEGLLVIADSKLINANYLDDVFNSMPLTNIYYTFEEYWRDQN